MAITSNNTKDAIEKRKRDAVKIYGLVTEYGDMSLIQNLSVLVELHSILAMRYENVNLTPFLNQLDLEDAMSNVTRNLKLSTKCWTVSSHLTRNLGITGSSEDLIQPQKYLELLRESLEHVLENPSSTDIGLFYKLKKLGKPGEHIFLHQDIERIKALYLPGYIPSAVPPAAAKAHAAPAAASQNVQPTHPSKYISGQSIKFKYNGSSVSGTIVNIESASNGKDYKLTIDITDLGEQKKFMESALQIIK